MRRKWIDIKKGMSAAAILLATTALTWGAMTVRAEEDLIGKSRGYVNVDLRTFSEIHSSIDGSDDRYLAPQKDSDGARYMLYAYQDFFGDRDDNGVTYRSGSAYDMTDVTHIVMHGYPVRSHGEEMEDKFLFYINESDNIYYTNKEYDDIKSDLVSGNGMVERYINLWPDANKFKRYSYSVNARYSSVYVYIGMSCDFRAYDRKFALNNSRIIESDSGSGCLALKLKEHKMTLLEPDKLPQVVVDKNGKSSTKMVAPWGDLKLADEGGKKYSVGNTTSIYRDEQMTFLYTMAAGTACELDGFKIYSDADKTNLLYTMDVKNAENQCTFTFDTEMIQKMEKITGAYKLGNMYIQPIFSVPSATVEFSSNVVEAADKVEVVETGNGELKLREQGYVDDAHIIGTFMLNDAAHIGDDLTVDYIENKDYKGPYEFRYYEFRVCDSVNQVSGADINTAEASADKIDIQQTLSDTYFWLRAHISLSATVTLEPKTVVFNNKEVKIGEAKVEGVEGKPQPTGKIRYHYYTDEACTNELEKDTYPINAGTYYVTATLGQDEYYASVTSAPVKLIIEQAEPVLKNLKGLSIEYGEEMSKSILSGEAYGVTGQEISGTFAWVNISNKTADKVGTITEEVVFTPDNNWNTNYKAVIGNATIKVGKATPTVTVVPQDKVFDGEPVTSVPVSVIGVKGEETGQKVYFDFYRLINGEYEKIDREPVNAGVYYVSAYVSGNTNYGFAESTKKEFIITKRESNLVIVPLNDTIYRVYVTNAVANAGPSGKINLKVNGATTGTEQVLVTETVGEKVRYYAEFTLDTKPSSLKAEYHKPIFNDNYQVNAVSLTLPNNSDDPAGPDYASENHKSIILTYSNNAEVAAVLDVKTFQALNGMNDVNVTWLNKDLVHSRDVIDLTADNSGGYSKLQVTIENTGEESVIAYVTGVDNTAKKHSWYVFFDITVQPEDVTVTMEDKCVTYTGEPVAANTATALPAIMPITYAYYTDAACTEVLNGLPEDTGIYYVKARTEATRNYKAGEGDGKVIINPAEVQITVNNKIVTYTGEAQGLEQPVITGINPTGRVVLCYGCGVANCSGCKEPVDAGDYSVKGIYLPGEKDNYARTEASATLTIEPADCSIELMPKEVIYTGNPVEIEPPLVQGVHGEGYDEVIGIQEGAITYFYSLSTEMKYQATPPTEAGLYYVYAYRKDGGNYKAVMSNRTTLLIKPAELTISLENVETTYSGNDVKMDELSPAKITNQNEELIVSGSVVYEYYLDKDATLKLDAEYPKDAGIYYVKAIVSNESNYNKAESNIAELVIKKATPSIVASASDITYGEMADVSELTGTATGVNGEALSGVFTWKEAIGHEKYEAGTKTLGVTFIPDGEWQKNYTQANVDVELVVKRAQPELIGSDKSVVYDGEIKAIDPVMVKGVDGMDEPLGTVVYQYFTDEQCTQEVTEIKDAKTYYCKAIYQPNVEKEKNYQEAISVYKITIEKADAVITLRAIPDLEEKTVTLAGAVVGLLDNPTGSIELFVRSKGSDTYEAIGTTKLEGRAWSEYAFVHMFNNAKGVYDFKAVYKEGEKKNYNIMDGEVPGVDMNKKPQHIYFEESVIDKVYGTGDFEVQVLSDAPDSTGDITYKVTRFGNPGAIMVDDEGVISIKDSGYAFLMANKAADDTYGAAYAVAMVRISKAPVEIELEDESYVYDGKEKELSSVNVISNGNKVDLSKENIQIVYSYKHVETGKVLERLPLIAGEYEVTVYTEGNRHYLANSEEAVAKLTIEKARANIGLEISKKDKENKKVTLEGTVKGSFDNPTGTITLYQKQHGQPDDTYTIVEEGVEMTANEDGTYGFAVTADVELNKVYDFKAHYEEGRVQNYIIEDGEMKKVIVIGFGGDDDDDNKPNDGNKPEDGDNSEDSGTSKDEQTSNDNNSVDTNDVNSPVKYLVLMMLSMVLAFTVKRVGRR